MVIILITWVRNVIRTMNTTATTIVMVQMEEMRLRA